MKLECDLPESVVTEAIRDAWSRAFSAWGSGRELVAQQVKSAAESKEMRDTVSRLVGEQSEAIARRVVAEEWEKHLRKLARKAAMNVTLPDELNLLTK